MIDIRIIHPATATEQQMVVEATEQLCEGYCITSSKSPLASITFSNGAVKVIDGLAVIPITAIITVVLPNQCSCNCKRPQVYAETFNIAFTATDANNVTLTPGATVEVVPANTKCCSVGSIKVITSLTATIA